MNNFRFDTHMHLDLFNYREKVIEDIEKNKSYTIAVTNLPILYEKYIKMYNDLKYIKFALGFHPELVYEYKDQLDIFFMNINNSKYIGEIGLDYRGKDLKDREYQKYVFTKIIDKCNSLGGKVLTIHSRGAVNDVNRIIGKFNGSIIMHWFTGSEIELKKGVDNGYYFSVNEKMIKKKDLIAKIPINRILVETDAPFLNGNRNIYSCSFINKLIRELSNIYRVSEDIMNNQLKNNFKNVLNVSLNNK